MATRSVVGTYTDGGKHWRGRYVHWDGYPEGRLPVLSAMIDRDGALKTLQTIMRYRGWSNLDPDMAWDHQLERGYDDGRFEVVAGYGIAYTEKQGVENRYETDRNVNSGCEYAYIIDLVERCIDVYEYVWDEKAWRFMRSVPTDGAYIPA